jgi:uncharacterized protein YndB with AHSA1/START domain
MEQNDTSMSLEGDRSIIISRLFNAPSRIVFRAWTEPELVKRWWAPLVVGVSMVSCLANVRVGGNYRYVLQNPDGGQIAFSGVYAEIDPPTRLVYSQVLEPMADAGEAVITVTFTDEANRTRMISSEHYPSAQVRDMVLASGMEQGMRITMAQLDALVAELDE